MNCPICHKIYKRLNNFHLKTHNITTAQFESMYPDCVRTEKDETLIIKQNELSGEVGIDYIICPICGLKFLEINTAHLKSHGLNAKMFDNIYGYNCRICKKVITKKNTLGNGRLTVETSNKLKFGHTLEAYILKYGEIDGTEKYNQKIIRYSKSKTLNGYIDKFGEEEGIRRYKNSSVRKGRDLKAFIEKYGECDGIIRYTNMIVKKRNHGLIKNRDDFKQYRKMVIMFTNITIKRYNIPELSNRSRLYHLDHMISIYDGYLNKIHPIYVGSFYNLRVVPYHENCHKQKGSIGNIEKLIKLVDDDTFYKNVKSITEDRVNDWVGSKRYNYKSIVVMAGN